MIWPRHAYSWQKIIAQLIQLISALVKEISIKDFAKLVQKTVNYNGKIVFDKTKPDGAYRKLLNVKKINKLGWFAKTSVEKGLKNIISGI